MKIFISTLVHLLLLFPAIGQQPLKPITLYGQFHRDSLKAPAFESWFGKTYQDYLPDSVTLNALRKTSLKEISIEVFLGTWCGDSKREVPRLLKLLDQINFPSANIHLVGVGGSDSLYKQSPGGEQTGKGIFRVPTIIVSHKGRELNRINEYPSISLEKDLLAILGKQSYTPNYSSFSLINSWLSTHMLTDPNVSHRSLASRLKPHVHNEFELNSLGYLLLNHHQTKQAIKLFQVNQVLFPESSNTTSSLGEGYLKVEEYQLAINQLEKSLELNKNPSAVREILALLYQARKKAGL